MEKFGSGKNIPDPQHCSAQLTTFMFKSPYVSSCRYWLRSEKLLVWLEALAAAGAVWLETLAAACLVWGKTAVAMIWGQRNSRYGLSWGPWDLRCRYGLMSEQLQVWIEVWAAAAIVQGRSEQAICVVRFLSRVADPDPKSSCFEVLDGLFWEQKASSVTWTFLMEA